ncbi:hypothetical protein [Parasphingorhabdus sp.]|uniref:hypothetical protein n=1 Tax=Parasphingorhabdus sp. TaxID=2709688 RepID=UPI0030019D59
MRRGIMLICLLLITACASQEKLAETVRSPDGSMTAKLFVTDLGACCSPHARVELSYRDDQSAGITKEVYSSAGGWPLKIEWIDNWNLVVTACDAHTTKMKSSIYTEKTAENDYRLLNIISAHGRGEQINGKTYCALDKG